MIWGVIAIIGSLLLRAKAVVLIPLVYLLARKSKDLGLLAYFFYAIWLMNDVFVKDFLSFEAIKVLLLGVLPSLMVLREVLVGVEFRGSYNFKKPDMKVFLDLRVVVFVLVVVGLMVVLRLRYEYLYTVENQVSLMAGLSMMFLLLSLKREVKKVEMFK
ncbi:hypothetical protein NF865_02315 [Thermococcus aggregans]|uniref:Uncharacterized protein n=1 Tax=Thermococcus aggregans TaxID=110163 RepID=A0A9E7MYC1_THEAG|nr:hypothetical protein [Thermococcus aggregans]USS41072.1 hypothetical protein NF865_02315 [Thermococcus aggregans]